MESIGERFEEARKRKGISLREAAEATKIRGDFLAYFEQDKFDFELPDLYKRGFIKNYARYLKLDPDKALADYIAGQLSKSRLGKKNGSELFGSMDAAPEEGSYGTITAKPTQATRPIEEHSEHSEHSQHSEHSEHSQEESEGEGDKMFYVKVGLVFAGTLALAFVIFGLIQAILSSGSDAPAEEPELREAAPISRNINSDTPTTSAASDDTVTLIASGNVFVLVRQRTDKQVLYRDTMSAGQTIALQKDGPVDILFTAGENIVIDHAGERLRPSSSGTAKITLP
jgi:cytoskeleton protein RodZ